MNRTFKFRGIPFAKDNFVYGSLVVQGDRYFICVDFESDLFYEVQKNSVSQFVEIYDSNYTDIYEHDVIKLDQTINGCNLFEVIYFENKFTLKYAVNMVVPRVLEYDTNILFKYIRDLEVECIVIGNTIQGVKL